jgi:hypothetical protein
MSKPNKLFFLIMLIILIILILFIYFSNQITTFIGGVESDTFTKAEILRLEDTINTMNTMTYPEMTIIKEALKQNDNKLANIRYNNLSNQDKINDKTERLNKLNYSISTLTQKNKPNYNASGALNFF